MSASAMNTNLTYQTGFVNALVGYAIRSITPVTTMTQNPDHMSGKNFSNSELLSLQAGMYKYSQELELTSKVVEKATSGLKDTLKTQV